MEITEPNVNILAVQGPLSDNLLAKIFGEEIRQLKFLILSITNSKEKNILLLDLDGLNKAVLKYMLKMIKLVKTYMTICLNMVKNLMLKQDVQI